MTTIKDLEEYFKKAPQHLRETEGYWQYMCFVPDRDEMETYQKESEESEDWEVIVDDYDDGESFFGAVNRKEKRILVLDYPNISVYLDIHPKEKTFLANTKKLEEIRDQSKED